MEAVCTSLMQRSSEPLVSSVRLQHPPPPKHISNQYPANHAGRGAAESMVVHACRKEETVCHCTLLSLSHSLSLSLCPHAPHEVKKSKPQSYALPFVFCCCLILYLMGSRNKLRQNGFNMLLVFELLLYLLCFIVYRYHKKLF